MIARQHLSFLAGTFVLDITSKVTRLGERSLNTRHSYHGSLDVSEVAILMTTNITLVDAGLFQSLY